MNLLLAFLSCIMISFSFACDLQQAPIAVCVKDVQQFCKIELFPYTVQSIYDSRDCLRKNRNSVSQKCLDYLQLDKPSIVESCLPEMKKSCSNVVPGCFDVHTCLSGVLVDELSQSCKDALDEESSQNKGNISPSQGYRIVLWNSWTKTVMDLSKYVFFTLNQLSQGNYLRGSIYVQIMGNEEADNDDDDSSSDDATDDGYYARLQEWRQEYFKEWKHKN